jgi:hypothetical protein
MKKIRLSVDVHCKRVYRVPRGCLEYGFMYFVVFLQAFCHFMVTALYKTFLKIYFSKGNKVRRNERRSH